MLYQRVKKPLSEALHLDLSGLGIGKYIYGLLTKDSSSLSFELVVVSFMQEDAYIGYTALALTLGLQVFS